MAGVSSSALHRLVILYVRTLQENRFLHAAMRVSAGNGSHASASRPAHHLDNSIRWLLVGAAPGCPCRLRPLSPRRRNKDETLLCVAFFASKYNHPLFSPWRILARVQVTVINCH